MSLILYIALGIALAPLIYTALWLVIGCVAYLLLWLGNRLEGCGDDSVK